MTDFPVVNQAIILAGGQATRLQPLTEDMPKAMALVAGVPIVAYQLWWLVSQGVTQVVLSCGPHADVLRAYVGNGQTFNINATYAAEETPHGTGGGLKFAARSLPDPSRFLVLNGDVITRFPLHSLTEYHHYQNGMVTLALVPYRSNWGVVDLDEGGIVRGFRHAPVLPYWISAGVCVCESELVNLLPNRGDHDSIFQGLAKAGRMFGYRIDDYWRGIDTVKDLQIATLEIVKQGYNLPEHFIPKDVS